MSSWLKKMLGAGVTGASERLYRLADAVGASFGGGSRARPAPINIGGRHIDTIEDLSVFTDLSPDIVEREVLRRRHINFRNEWFATPRQVRNDHWFYLSSKAYLFTNASHFTDETFVQGFVRRHLEPGQCALDFGGGSGELALRLAGAGISTALVELNALQRDFVRFRVRRHELEGIIDVLDPWVEVPRDGFDAVVAMDVIEHLPNPRETLEGKLVPALRSSGVFIENSPFVADPWNPMHHDDFGLDSYMRDRSFRVVGEAGLTRAWRREAEGPVAST